MRRIFFVFVLLLVSLVFPVSSFATNDSPDCPVFKPETSSYFPFASENDKKKLVKLRNGLCRKIENKELAPQIAILVLNEDVLRAGCCRGNLINPEFKNYLEKVFSKEVIKTFEIYCRKSYDSKFHFGLKKENRHKLYQWWRIEFLCQVMRQVAYPEMSIDISKPGDLPSLEVLRRQAFSICKDLRDGNISVDEGWYRWNQEWSWFVKQYGGELKRFWVEKAFGSLEFVVDLLK
jgi:hypothetical protein